MFDTQAEIELLKDDVSFVCSYGALKRPHNLPEEIKHAYNRILFDLGNATGWKDYSKLIIDDSKLTAKLGSSLDIYKEANNSLRLTHSDDLIKLLPDVLILESWFNKSLSAECAASIVFSTLTVIRLIEFHKYFSTISNLDVFEKSYDNLLAICNGQVHLLAAQDAVNKSREYLFKLKYPIEHQISKEEVSFYFKLETDKELKAKGGRKSQYDAIYNWSIKAASEKWKAEKKASITITRIGKMAEILKAEYLLLNNEDREAKVIPLDLLKDKIRFLAKAIAPEALKGGRPKKTP